MCVRLYRVFADCVTVSSRECLAPLVVVSLYVQVAECYKGHYVEGRMHYLVLERFVQTVMGEYALPAMEQERGSGKVSFGRRIREDPYLRIQSELYTHSEVVRSPK